jgi:hypothetical protein
MKNVGPSRLSVSGTQEVSMPSYFGRSYTSRSVWHAAEPTEDKNTPTMPASVQFKSPKHLEFVK